MKVYYFEINVPLEVEQSPEYIRTLNIFVALINRMYGGLSVEKGFYIVTNDSGDNEKGFIFCDEYTHKKNIESLDYLISKFDGVSYKLVDVTLDVKLGRCELPKFIEIFKSEDSDFDHICNLDDYLDVHVTHDDVLIKIHEMGINSLSDKELNILNEYSKFLQD